MYHRYEILDFPFTSPPIFDYPSTTTNARDHKFYYDADAFTIELLQLNNIYFPILPVKSIYF